MRRESLLRFDKFILEVDGRRSFDKHVKFVCTSDVDCPISGARRIDLTYSRRQERHGRRIDDLSLRIVQWGLPPSRLTVNDEMNSSTSNFRLRPWESEVKCSGAERRLKNCSSSPWKNSAFCHRKNIATVSCGNNRVADTVPARPTERVVENSTSQPTKLAATTISLSTTLRTETMSRNMTSRSPTSQPERMPPTSQPAERISLVNQKERLSLVNQNERLSLVDQKE